MLLPFFLGGQNHWIVIMTYLILFDFVNAIGHTNIVCQHWLFVHPLSPLRYLIYTPEFHLGHHHYFTCNFGLFMPIWDHMLGTYREYKKADPKLLSGTTQDFVFIGHNGGLGHLLTCPGYLCFLHSSLFRSLSYLPPSLTYILSTLNIHLSLTFPIFLFYH